MYMFVVFESSIAYLKKWIVSWSTFKITLSLK